MGIFEKYKKEIDVEEKIINKYNAILPIELIKVWRFYGFGSLFNGYLKVVNPDSYQELVNDSYFRGNVSIPIFVTGFGDIITWEENKYLRMIEFNKGRFYGISSGFDFFWEDITTKKFQDKYFDIQKYNEAVVKYGNIKFDECFGYVPLLGLGGSERVDNLKIVKTREHIELITQLVGRIE